MHYNNGTDIRTAVALARSSTVAVVVVHDIEAERHDRTSLSLPGNQDALVAAVAAANPRTVVVLETGAAVLMPWLSSVHAAARDLVSRPSRPGTSLVDLLSGRVNPSGKLPVTFPTAASPAAMPDDTAADLRRRRRPDRLRRRDRTSATAGTRPTRSPALFSFGYGLSYTRFHFAGLAGAKPRPPAA